jgi:ATP-dependent DNA helicase RecQ
VRTGLPAAQAVDRAVAIAQRRREVVRSRIDMMRGYAETTGCRRRALLAYYGEQHPQPCGNCDSCAAGTARPVDPDDAAAADLRPQQAVRHPEWGEGVVMLTEADRVTVLFADTATAPSRSPRCGRTTCSSPPRSRDRGQPGRVSPPTGASTSPV